MSQKKDGKIWIEGMENALSDASLSGHTSRAAFAGRQSVAVLPNLWIIKIGGQSIMDRGAKAVHPILEELVAAKNAGTQFILGAGGGTRARHIYSLGLDLKLPTGVLAHLGSSVPMQNARMLQLLMAKDGGVICPADDVDRLPFFLNSGCIPIMSGMPPFEFWEKNADVGLIPSNRTDAGVYLLAEFLGARGVLYIKDEDGLYTDDPKKNPSAKFVQETTAKALLEGGQDDIVVERSVLQHMQRAQKVREIRIVNGLKRGQITAALRGDNVGTLIRAN